MMISLQISDEPLWCINEPHVNFVGVLTHTNSSRTIIFNRLMKQSSAKQGYGKRGVASYSPKNGFQIAINK